MFVFLKVRPVNIFPSIRVSLQIRCVRAEKYVLAGIYFHINSVILVQPLPFHHGPQNNTRNPSYPCAEITPAETLVSAQYFAELPQTW